MKTRLRNLFCSAMAAVVLLVALSACTASGQTVLTFAALSVANTFTAVQTFSSGIVIGGGTTITTETGSGALVRATSPTLTTPNIGAATATSITWGSAPALTTSPIMTYTCFASGMTLVGSGATPTPANGGCAGMILPNNAKIVGAGWSSLDGSVSCTNPTFWIWDGTQSSWVTSVPVTNLTSGNIAMGAAYNYTFGGGLELYWAATGGGCDGPNSATISIFYQMRQ